MKHSRLGGILSALFFVAGSAAAQETVGAQPGKPVPADAGKPTEIGMRRAGSTTKDLRLLPQTKPEKFERPEREEPEINRVELPGGPPAVTAPVVPGRSAPAPAPDLTFRRSRLRDLGRRAIRPTRTATSARPTTSRPSTPRSAIYEKSDGAQVAAFTFNTFMSQGTFGNLCDTNNFGDPVVLYDTFEDRWVITDFAFQLDGSRQRRQPARRLPVLRGLEDRRPGHRRMELLLDQHDHGGLNDYPKFGIWPDGIYMSANMFGYRRRRLVPDRPRLGAQQGADVRRQPDGPGRLVQRAARRLHAPARATRGCRPARRLPGDAELLRLDRACS